MPFSIEVILPKQAKVGVNLRVRVWFLLFYFKSGQINFEICLATSCKMSMMFTLVRPIALDIPQTLDSTRENSVFPLPAIFVLRDTWIHICTMNGHNIASNIE